MCLFLFCSVLFYVRVVSVSFVYGSAFLCVLAFLPFLFAVVFVVLFCCFVGLCCVCLCLMCSAVVCVC